jgi:hypothetical protein
VGPSCLRPYVIEREAGRVQGRLQLIRRPVQNYCGAPPPLVYIVYWYICLTINRVKVHKYFFYSKITMEFAEALHVTREIVNY